MEPMDEEDLGEALAIIEKAAWATKRGGQVFARVKGEVLRARRIERHLSDIVYAVKAAVARDDSVSEPVQSQE